MVHQATVISIEESTALSDAHLASALRHNVSNNAVCRKAVDDSLMRKFWESPEFVRFQVLSGGLVDLVREHGVKSLKVGGWRPCPNDNVVRARHGQPNKLCDSHRVRHSCRSCGAQRMIGKMLGVGMTTFMEVRGCFTGCPIGRVLACSRTTPPALPSPTAALRTPAVAGLHHLLRRVPEPVVGTPCWRRRCGAGPRVPVAQGRNHVPAEVPPTVR